MHPVDKSFIEPFIEDIEEAIRDEMLLNEYKKILELSEKFPMVKKSLEKLRVVVKLCDK